jgi:hypothetical protein
MFFLFVFSVLSFGSGTALAADEIVCITCHSALPEKFSQPAKLWKGSIHQENGIACNACHGGDPKDAANAMKKERGFLGAPKYNDVPEFCGRCHVGVLKDYLASGHGRALAKGGPNCVICHGSHQIVKASLELINEKSCSRCHSYERAKLIRGAMQETEALIVSIDARIKAFKQVGVDTERMEKELFATRNQFHSLFHNVDVKKVTEESVRIKGELKKTETALAALDEQKGMRKKIGVLAVSGALLAALLVHFLRKTLD